MQNIKNFTLRDPLPGEEVVDGVIPLYLVSEDGHDWYECQSLFAEDTVKIMYNKDNVICSVVDSPVAERGNTYAVGMLFPEGMSVAEVLQKDYPADATLDGTWKFDGQKVYQDQQIVTQRIVKKNTALLDTYKATANAEITSLQTAISLNRAPAGSVEKLTQWQGYLCDLNEMTEADLTLNPAIFPVQPSK